MLPSQGTAPECNAWRDFGVSCKKTSGGGNQQGRRRRRKPESLRTGLAAEQVGDARQFREKTVDEELPVPPERVQQLTAEEIGNVLRVDKMCSAPATATTVARSVRDGETRLPELEKDSTTTDSDTAVSSGEAGPSWPKASSVNSQRVLMELGLHGPEQVEIVRPLQQTLSAGKARPPGIAKQSATTEPEFAERSGEVGPSWSRTDGMNNAAARVIPRVQAKTGVCSTQWSWPRWTASRLTNLPFRSGFLRGCVTRSADNICSVTSSCGVLEHRRLCL